MYNFRYFIYKIIYIILYNVYKIIYSFSYFICAVSYMNSYITFLSVIVSNMCSIREPTQYECQIDDVWCSEIYRPNNKWNVDAYRKSGNEGLHNLYSSPCAPGSSVGIATDYGLYGPGIYSRWGARFSASIHAGPGGHPASCTMRTLHSLLVPWSRKSRAIPLLLLWAVQPVQSLSACTVQL